MTYLFLIVRMQLVDAQLSDHGLMLKPQNKCKTPFSFVLKLDSKDDICSKLVANTKLFHPMNTLLTGEIFSIIALVFDSLSNLCPGTEKGPSGYYPQP